MIPNREQEQLRQLNESLEMLFSTLGSHPSAQLNRQPEAGVWSPLMVAKHVMLVEGHAIRYVNKKLSFNPEIGKAGLQAKLRGLVLDLYFKSPLKRKAPSAVGDQALAGPHDLELIRDEWYRQRNQLQTFMENMPEDRYEEEVYKHPIVGRLSISGMLRFFQGHFDRHRRQIESRLEG